MQQMRGPLKSKRPPLAVRKQESFPIGGFDNAGGFNLAGTHIGGAQTQTHTAVGERVERNRNTNK